MIDEWVPVTWSDATIASSTSSTVVVLPNIHGPFPGGAAWVNEVLVEHVRPRPGGIEIGLHATVRARFPSGATPGVWSAPRPLAVDLPEPLSESVLVDSATGRPHPVLVADRTPTLRDLPAGMRETSLRWLEAHQLVAREFRAPARQPGAAPASLMLRIGPTPHLRDRTGVRLPVETGPGGVRLQTWADDEYGTVAVFWYPGDGRTCRVDGEGVPVEEVLRAVRSFGIGAARPS